MLKENGSTSISKLSLVKSLPSDKKKIGTDICIALLFSIILSILAIITTYILASIRGMVDYEKGLIIFYLLAIKLPMVISAMFIILPNAIFRGYISHGYINSNRKENSVVLAYFLAIGGTALTLFALQWSLHIIIRVFVSAFLYVLAIC